MNPLAGLTATLLASMCAAAPAQDARAILRPGEVAPSAVVLDVGPQGVGVRRAEGSETLSWDRVEAVEGPLASSAMPYAALSDVLWRARTRLMRGDLVGAEPLFERAARMLPAASPVGPTSGLIYEGLTRCRAARGAQTGAVDAWTLMIASGAIPRMQSEWSGPGFGQPELINPQLPPMWLPTDAVQIFAQSPGPEGSSVDALPARAAAIWRLYRAAAEFEVSGGDFTNLPTLPPNADAGWTLIDLCVRARVMGDSGRAAARNALFTLLESAPRGWREAWIRAAIGRSLLREASAEDRMAGVVQIMHLPARLVGESPHAAAVSMRDAAIALNDLGQTAEAIRIRDELARLLPGHPVLNMPPLNAWPSAAPSVPAVGTASESTP